jgi:mRNA-degrading endonuclease RelE of RelBE toxin-antitoxin system
MKIRYTATASKAFDEAPEAVQKAFLKQIGFLKDNLKHPSLHAKKYDESQDLWQARVNQGWRFYFSIAGDTYIIHRLIPHPK